MRRLLRRPAFLVLGSLTLALGVATVFATFAVVDALLLVPPAFRFHRNVVLYGEMPRPSPTRGISASLYEWVGLPPEVLSRGLARAVERASVTTGTHAGVLPVQRIDEGFLPTLGVVPAAGTLSLDAAGRDAALISWRLWHAWFGADPAVAGRGLVVDGRTLPVVGVLPEGYRVFDDVDVWLPLRPAPGPSANMANYYAVARMAPDSSIDALADRVRAIASRRLGELGMPPQAAAWFGVTPIDDALRGYAAPTLWFFLGCAGLVLTTACGNLANLMLARALGRSRETALHLALGAGFWRAWATVAVEAAGVGIVGLVAGVLIGTLLVDLVQAYVPERWLVNAGPITVGGRVYVAAALAAFSATTVAALGGTLHEQGDALLREHVGAGRDTSLRRVAQRVRIVTVQIQLALATVLLALCAGQATRAWRWERIVPGFDMAGGVTAAFRPDPAHFNGIGRVATAMQAMELRTRRIPGVEVGGVSTQLPAGTRFVVAFSGPRGVPVEAQFALQTPGAREALGWHLMAGRDLTVADDASATAVTVVNEAFLASVPGARLGGTVRKVSRSLGDRSLTIVGVVADTRDAGPGVAARPLAMVPFAQLPPAEFSSYRHLLSYYVVARGRDDASLAGVDIGASVRAVAPWIVLEQPRTLARVWRDAHADLDRDTSLTALFAGLGVSLGLLGLYSAQRVEVASRHRDFALYASLGATPLDLWGWSFARGLARASVGIAMGLAGASAWRRWGPDALLPGGHFDATEALLVAVGMLALAAAVTMPPAWRAALTRPRVVLRDD